MASRTNAVTSRPGRWVRGCPAHRASVAPMKILSAVFVSSVSKIRPESTLCRDYSTWLISSFVGVLDILICGPDVGGKLRGTFTAIGFVLIDIEPTREKEVYQKLLKIKDIVELYPLFGEYDLIAKVEADSYDAIGKLVVSKIRSIEGVKATKTLARVAF